MLHVGKWSNDLNAWLSSDLHALQRIVRLGGAVDDDMANLIVVSAASQYVP